VIDDSGRVEPAGSAWRRNLGFIWFGVFVALLGGTFVFPFVPSFIEELGVTERSRIAYYTGLCASITGLSLAVSAPVWGLLADRVGRKLMFLRALVGAGLVLALTGLAHTVWQLVILRFVLGAFAGALGSAAALIAATTPRQRVGRAVSRLQTAAFAATALGPLVGGAAAAVAGIREAFVLCAALYFIAALLVWLFVRESYPTTAASSSPRPAGRGPSTGLRPVLRDRQMLLLLLVLFGIYLGTGYVRPVMPISINDFSGSSDGRLVVRVSLPHHSYEVSREAAIGLAFSLMGAANTIAALAVAPFAQRLGYRTCVIGASITTGLLYLPVAFAPTFLVFLLALVAVGLFQGAMVPGTNALIAVAAPGGTYGSVFGVATSIQAIAMFVAPLAGGITSGIAGLRAAYLSVAVILLTVGSCAIFLADRRDVDGDD
jgi:DHA1 family multidrug resistance protein-like MFS transporter